MTQKREKPFPESVKHLPDITDTDAVAEVFLVVRAVGAGEAPVEREVVQDIKLRADFVGNPRAAQVFSKALRGVCALRGRGFVSPLKS